MALNEQQVMEALRPVTDPELRVSIVELGMVRDVHVRWGRVTVTAALSAIDLAARHGFTGRITAALSSLSGVRSVSVNVVAMSPAELAQVRARMQAGEVGPAAPAAPAAPGAPPPQPHAPAAPAAPPPQPHASAPHAPAAPPPASAPHAATPAPSAGPPRAARQPLGHESGRSNVFMDPTNATRVIGITSGKGGVGKSSVTVNLAVSLVKAGHDVAILDADVYGFSVPAMLGIGADPEVDHDKMLPPAAHGVRCMSIGFFVDEDQPVMWRGPMLHKALEQFLVDVDWGNPDYLLVDMPPGTGDVALSMSQYLPASEVFVVTTPQPAARRVAQRSAYMARKINMPLRGVIENMSWFTGDDGKRYELFGRGGGEQLAAELKVPLLGQVPLDNRLREGGDIGRPVTVAEPDGDTAKAFDGIAALVVARGRGRVFRPELTIR